jgi:hypothetical protein
MELQRGRRVKVPGGMKLGSRVLLLLHVIPGLKDRFPCLKESLLFSFDVVSANLPFKCAREGVLHCEQLMNASSPSSTHTMTADLSANSRITRSLARSRSARLARDGGGGGGGQGVGTARWRARDAWQRLAAPRYAKVRQGLYYSLPATYMNETLMALVKPMDESI